MSEAVRPLQLGKYRLIASLGQGGAASVYLAVATGPAGVNKLLVVKVLRKELAAEPDNVRMFLDEARLSTRLNHPNIVQMLEVGRDGEFYFIVMEYLEGKPFNRLMAGDLPGIGQNVLLHLLGESLGGLHEAHELADYNGTPLGVVHRDVSPNNIFITYDGRAKVLDFGVAKTFDSTQTEYGVVKGKPRYMAPEQALGQNLDRRADVFSAGVILWEIVAGRRLWAGKHDMAVLFAVSNGQIPELAEFAPDAPPELARIVARALAPAKEDRYPTALALQEDIEAYLRTTGEQVTARNIGRALMAQFGSERARLKAQVDAQLRAMATLSGEFEVVALRSNDGGFIGGEGSHSNAEGGRSAAVPVRFALSTTPTPPKSNHAWLFVAGAIGVAVIGVLGWRSVPSNVRGHAPVDAPSAAGTGQPPPPAIPPPPVMPVTAPPTSASAPAAAATAPTAPAAPETDETPKSGGVKHYVHSSPRPTPAPPPQEKPAPQPSATASAAPPAPTNTGSKKRAVDRTDPYAQ